MTEDDRKRHSRERSGRRGRGGSPGTSSSGPDGGRFFRLALELNPDVVLLLDLSGSVVFANAAALRRLGAGADALAGASLKDSLRPVDAQTLKDALGRFGRGESRWASWPGVFPGGGETPGSPAEFILVALEDGDEKHLAACYVRPRPAAEPGLELAGRVIRAVEQVEEAVVITDLAGHIEYVNPAFEKITGWPRAEALGKTPRILKSGKHSQDDYKNLWGTLLRGESYRGVIQNRRRDGSVYHEAKTITPVRDDAGAVTHFIATGMDVTGHALAQEAVRAEAERYALSLEGADDGLWDWDLATDRIFLSTRCGSMLGYADGVLGDRPENWIALVHPEDRPAFEARIRAHIDGTEPRLHSEHRMRNTAGDDIWVRVRGLATRDPVGRPVRMAGSQTDITSHKLRELRLQQGALHDALTGLPNRVLLLDRLRAAMNRARRMDDYGFALLFMDLDRFKVINDGLGHLAGDQLLIEVGGRLSGCARAVDTVARLGGDEFAILLDGVLSEAEAAAFADRILIQCASPFTLEGRKVFTSASIGIALCGPSHNSPSDIVRDADTAMYYAKSRGRSRFAVFNEAMHSRAMFLLELETDLRAAVENNRLTVQYQPIVSLVTRCVVGFEALVRWLHPLRGYISPGEFVPVAEECGLIHSVGRFVLRESCRKLKWLQTRYPSRPRLMMSVNLSGVQFLRPDLLNQIEMVLREFGLDPRDLKLEITESVIIEHAEHAKLMIDQIKAQKIRLSIDDFGTGYSSMANLRKFPIDTVKIDQSFVRKMKEDSECLEIVRASITMAHNLGMDVIAEGVETPDEVRILMAMKCEYGQGYYFARPLDADSAEGLIARGGIM